MKDPTRSTKFWMKVFIAFSIFCLYMMATQAESIGKMMLWVWIFICALSAAIFLQSIQKVEREQDKIDKQMKDN